MANKNDSTESLFPILPNGSPAHPLSGIARLAAEATHTDDGHLIEFRAMTARSLLNRSVSRRGLPIDWSINPYRGCEFGCKYCYARYTHQFLSPEPVEPVPPGAYDVPVQEWALAFEHEIYLKENAAWLLEQELPKIDPEEEIAIGTATDPYQPIERRVGITRSLLEVLARHSGRKISVITKSSLITRDIDLLSRIAERNKLVLHITITTTDSGLARILEPRAPRPDLRFDALRKLREAGLIAGVLCSPLLPGINDDAQSIAAVAGRAVIADASFMGAHPLFLKSCSRPTYLSFVREHFPHLVEDYDRRFAHADFAAPDYRRKIATMVKAICRQKGIPQRSTDSLLNRVTGRVASAIPERKSPTSVRKPKQETDQTLLFAAS